MVGKHDAQEGHKLGTLKIQAVEVNNKTAGSRVPVVIVTGSKGPATSEDPRQFQPPIDVLGPVGKRLLLRDLTYLSVRSFTRQSRRTLLGVCYCSSCTQAGWFSTLPKAVDVWPSIFSP